MFLVRVVKTLWRHKKKTLATLLVVALAGLNVVAYLHAHAMTHFTDGRYRTPSPGDMSLGEKLETLLGGVRIPRPINHGTPARVGLPFTTVRFKARDGISLEAWRIERSESVGLVVLFHGYAGRKESLLKEAVAFHDLGYETFLVDFRGSGGSEGRVTTIGHDEAMDVAAALDFAAKVSRHERPILFGQSMGAAAVLRAIATQGVRPQAIILQAPFGRMLSTVRIRFRAMEVPAFPSAQLLVFWGGVQHGFNAFAHNPEDYATAVRCPTLLMHGDRDARVSFDEARRVFDRLAGRKRLEVFAGLGHGSLLARRAKWREAVRSFLGEESPATAR